MNKTVSLWISDKQDGLVTGIAAEIPSVPHRYCENHLLRDLAKTELEADRQAKVQMRRKVHRLRKIEQAVLKRQNAEALTSLAQDDPTATVTVIIALQTRLLQNQIRPAPWCSSIERLYVEF